MTLNLGEILRQPGSVDGEEAELDDILRPTAWRSTVRIRVDRAERDLEQPCGDLLHCVLKANTTAPPVSHDLPDERADCYLRS
jgi:hypothetical protein